ncbi:polyadenylate-binding protein 6-like [Dorcoceras hygrometricum]|uniref:Polyadenylate-binding protein 6-like n=1 Tax=Dorcoceras hygrometricum TaxID=472368 RepID=A0A2Z7DFY6_9LAMI|nr:polyadenylate-binding protein 6-like [Dorcoceras hygrometricum]
MGATESNKSREIDNGDDPSVPSWAKPGTDEAPPWALGETQKESTGFELPFYVYLLSSAVAAIAAVGSIFEYVNERPVFGILNSDSVLYAPLLGFFVFAGIPTSVPSSVGVGVASSLFVPCSNLVVVFRGKPEHMNPTYKTKHRVYAPRRFFHSSTSSGRTDPMHVNVYQVCVHWQKHNVVIASPPCSSTNLGEYGGELSHSDILKSRTMVERASLYVGDLHPDVSETELEETFRPAGQLLSVRLCRDNISGRSLSYAFVNFCFPVDALTALNRLNYTELRGRPMRIMWCEREPISSKGNLFVKNLGPSITSARLQEIFSKYGTVISCKVAEVNGKKKGYGFVQFDSEDSAMEALDAVHGTMQDGKKLSVSKFVRKNERNKEEPVFTNLYVKYLDEDITDDLLKNKFSTSGKIRSAVVMKDEKGRSKGFGFVNFCSHEDAKKAMEALNGELFGSKNLFVGRAQKKDERAETLRQKYGEKCTISNRGLSKNSKLYVKNLDVSVDGKKLKEIFCAHGRVISAKLIRNGDGTSKGFGFVHYLNPEDANKALRSLNGTNVAGRTLYVTMARPREQQTRASQPLYPANWHVPNTYSSLLVPKLSPFHPVWHQSFVPPFRSFYPFEAMNFQKIFSPYPLQFSTSRGCKGNQDHIQQRRIVHKTTDGDTDKSWKGCSSMIPELNKKGVGFMHSPQLLLDHIQK